MGRKKLSPGVHTVKVGGAMRKVRVLPNGKWRFLTGGAAPKATRQKRRRAERKERKAAAPVRRSTNMPKKKSKGAQPRPRRIVTVNNGLRAIGHTVAVARAGREPLKAVFSGGSWHPKEVGKRFMQGVERARLGHMAEGAAWSVTTEGVIGLKDGLRSRLRRI